MNPERAAEIFKEMLMTPVAELDQLPRRCGLDANPRPDDLEHARELLRAIIVGIQSGAGPNWDPIHTAWGAMVARHGHVQDSAMGPAPPEWIRKLPPKPSLDDLPPGAQPGFQEAQAAPPPQPMPAQPHQPASPQPGPDHYAAPPAGPPPAAPVPMGQPPMPMGAPPAPAAGHPVASPADQAPAPIPAHQRGPRKVARTEPGAPLPPPPPGRDAWPQPPAALHGGQPLPTPAGHVPHGAPAAYAPAEGYPARQALSPQGAPPSPQAAQPSPHVAPPSPHVAPPSPHVAPPSPHVAPRGSYPAAPQTAGQYASAPHQHGAGQATAPDAQGRYPAPPQPTGSGYPAAHAAPVAAPSPGYPSHPSHPSQPPHPSQPSQPAHPSAPPRQPAKTSQGDDIEMSVAKYAMFCAACAAHPDRVFQTMVEYGVTSPEAREKLDESWQDRFDDDPDLQKKWEELFAQFRGQFPK